MPLPDGFEWATSARFPDEWCVRRTDANYMLCGRVFAYGREQGFAPVLQPERPDNVHRRCATLAAGRHGVCPVCGGDVATDGGLLVPHGMWRVGVDGVERTDEPCPGAGQPPEVGG
jgi:hypothetical protein